ncbi:ROK family transcriptional regulator [Microbacterium sp.]|uniref:ROK family transcriptional regulator n=2 Tax=Microbacterium TaxID=33882 RepID=UPI001ACD386E|nr:ROK family transcriptional regulator [Microbacterium sp.]MBN9155943.1 ROK family transcriptional regulator [Microbacterium sp.]
MPERPTGTSVVRSINARAALRLLLDQGPLTRPEIARLLAVSKPTSSHLLAQLLDDGLVRSDGSRDGAIGRAAEVFRIDGRAGHAAAVDVTPERISAVVVDLAGTVVGSFTLSTPEGEQSTAATAPDPVERVQELLEGACASAGIPSSGLRRVVIGIQGATDPRADRVRFAAHLPGWQREGLIASLEERLGVPVDIENDVNLVVVAEHAHGAAMGHDVFAVLWVSDGIGMGVMLAGRVHRGLAGGAGEIADLPLPGAPIPPQVNEYGASGMQALAAAPALGRLLARHGFEGPSPAAALEAAVASDAPEATAVLDEIARRLALGLSAVVAIIAPELVVLAGDMAVAGGERLRALVERHLHDSVIARPAVLLTRLDESPVLDGARRLALARLQEEILVAAGAPRDTRTI